MSGLIDEVRRATPQALQATTGWFGVVTTGADDLSTKISVIVPGISTELPITGCRWQSRDATSMPAGGDQVLLLFDDVGNPWVVAWWPEGFDSE